MYQLISLLKSLFHKNCRRDLNELERAALEWENAVECFNQAGTNELIDVAIADINACKQRYVYLVRAQGAVCLARGAGKPIAHTATMCSAQGAAEQGEPCKIPSLLRGKLARP